MQREKGKRRRKWGGLIISLLLVLGLLAGCGGTQSQQVDPSQASSEKVTVARDGTYDSKEEVAEYILTYGALPSNYITKSEAKKLGWSGGSLEDYAPGKCIGGDRFGNYEERLPHSDDRNYYHECDIDTMGKSKRGQKRLIYGKEGEIYYTEDHYESFEQVAMDGEMK